MSMPAICCRRRHFQPQSDGVKMYRHINVQKGGQEGLSLLIHFIRLTMVNRVCRLCHAMDGCEYALMTVKKSVGKSVGKILELLSEFPGNNA